MGDRLMCVGPSLQNRDRLQVLLAEHEHEKRKHTEHYGQVKREQHA